MRDKTLPGWQVATALTATKINKQGFGTYLAANYDELVDCPVEMGPFWSGSFVAGGIPHRFVVAGAPPSFDGDRLLADTQQICEAEIRFWHGADQSAPAANHRIKTTCSCSTPWTTAMAGWSTATRPR